jgi:hypothetical protein
MSSRGRARRRFVERLQAVVLAVLFVAGELASFAHLTYEEHRRCPEHGELEHVAHAARAQAGLHAVDPRAFAGSASVDGPDRLPARVEGSGEVAHRHEHCGITALGREKVHDGQARAGLRPDLVQARARPVPSDVVRSENERWLLAPKHSPPERPSSAS